MGPLTGYVMDENIFIFYTFPNITHFLLYIEEDKLVF